MAENIEKFEEFFRKFYYDRLLKAGSEGEDSIVVDYRDLERFDPVLADLLLKEPNKTINQMKDSMENIDIGAEEPIHPRFENVPDSEKLRIKDVRSKHIGRLIKIEGVVKRASEVNSEVRIAVFECPDCGSKIEVPQIEKMLKYPRRCDCGRKRGFKLVDRKLHDTRYIILEDPFEMTVGEEPGKMTVFLKDDLTTPKMQRKTDPGGRLEVTGILKEIPKRVRGRKTKQLENYLECNHIGIVELELEDLEITDEDEEKIKKLAGDPKVYEKLIKSIAPSMYGLEDIKEALLLQLFGGVPQTLPDGTKIRGDIHVLIVGDPSSGKTQLLKLVTDLVPRGRYVSGKGTSVDFSEPLIIRKNGKIEILKIGDFIDKYYNKDGGGRAVIDEKVEALSLNLKTYELEWKPIEYVFRHKTNETLYKFELRSGREITVTGAHSIYTFENGVPTLKKASEIRKNQSILIPARIPTKISEDLNPDITRTLGYFIADGYLYTNENHYDYKVGFAFNKNEKNLINDLTNISQSTFNGYKPPIYYRNGKAEIMFRRKEIFNFYKKLLGDVAFKPAKQKRIPQKIFNVAQKPRREFIKGYLAGDSGVTKSRWLMSDLLYAYLLETIVASCSKRKEDGEVTFPDGHQSKISGYRFDLKGPDYKQPFETREIYRHPHFNSLDQTSKKYLLTQNNYSRERIKKANLTKNTLLIKRLKDLKEEKTAKELASKWNISRRSASQWLNKYAKRNFIDVRKTNNPVNKILERDKKGRIKKSKHFPQKAYFLSEKGKEILKSWKNLLKIFRGDMGFVKVKKINRVRPTSKYVYDISVKDNENFVAGFGGVICHNTAAGLCVTGDTRVVLKNGEIAEIGRIVEDEFKRNGKKIHSRGMYKSEDPTKIKILALDEENMKVKPLKVNQYWKIKAPDRLLKIKTRLGKEVKVTLDNPMPVFENGEIVWKKAKNLKEGEFLNIPRRINIESQNKTFITDFLDKTSHLQNSSDVINNFVNIIKENSGIRKFSKNLGISEDSLYYTWRDDDRVEAPKLSILEKISGKLGLNLEDYLPEKLVLSQKNGHTITLPKVLNKDVMYLLGLLAGDGNMYTTEHGGIGIRFTNSDMEMLSKFSSLCSGIGIKTTMSKRKDRTPTLRFASKIIGNLALNFGVPVGGKRKKLEISKKLSKLPNNLLSSYLQGIFDTDGSAIDRKDGASYVDVTSASKKFLEVIQTLLLRFGIISKIKERNPTESLVKGRKVESNKKYSLEIKGKENLEKFKNSIGFAMGKKEIKLDRIIDKIKKYDTNIDLVPGIGNLLKEARTDTNLSAKELYGYKNYLYESVKRSISRRKLQEIINKLVSNGYKGELTKFADSDLFFDRIKEIKEIKPAGEWVYDLTVEKEHSFLANGLIVHNTATVTRDEEFMGGWVLEAGAVVLANKSIIGIDEFDKMGKEDQINLHESMSTQTVSISKATIQATLPAQTSIVAGCNPKLSRFDPYRPISEQIEIPDTLLSLDHSEPLLVKENDVVKLKKIGEFVDSYYEKKDTKEPVFLKENIKVASMDPKDFKIKWMPVNYVFRHSINKPILKLSLETGREISVTRGHSVYVWKDGEIKPIPTGQIKEGDFVVIPKKLPTINKNSPEISLVDELLKLPKDKRGIIFLHNVPTKAIKRLGIKDKNWRNDNKLPLEYAEKLKKEELNQCGLKYKGGVKTQIPVKIPINKEFVRLLGYYVAEGSLFISGSSEHLMSLSFNKKESDLINDVKKISKKLFNHEPSAVKDKNAVKLNIANKLVYLLFEEILEVEKGSKNKRVPELVFNLPQDLQKEFLRAYHKGDYCVTTSRDLMSDLHYLLLQNGIIASSRKERPKEVIFPDGHKTLSSECYSLNDADFRIRNFQGIKWYGGIPLNPVKDAMIALSQADCKAHYYGKSKPAKSITGEKFWLEKFLDRDTRKKIKRLNILREPLPVDEFTQRIHNINKEGEKFRSRREFARQYLDRLLSRGLVKRKKINNLYHYELSERGERVLKEVETVEKLFKGNLGFVKVKKIEQTEPTNSYVYDISVPNCENFVAGFGGVICHNSRFDIKFILRDVPEKERDEKLVEHVIKTRTDEEKVKPLIDPELLRKYVAYARKNVDPHLTKKALAICKNFFVDLRSKYASEESAVPLTLRQYEALIRLSEAAAKVRLSNKVEEKDAKRAIKIMKRSIKQLGYDPETGKIDIDRAEGGVSSSKRNKIRIVMDTLDELKETIGKNIPVSDLISALEEEGIEEHAAEAIIREMKNKGMLFEPRSGYIQKI